MNVHKLRRSLTVDRNKQAVGGDWLHDNKTFYTDWTPLEFMIRNTKNMNGLVLFRATVRLIAFGTVGNRHYGIC
jgi:hypothetical protein